MEFTNVVLDAPKFTGGLWCTGTGSLTIKNAVFRNSNTLSAPADGLYLTGCSFISTTGIYADTGYVSIKDCSFENCSSVLYANKRARNYLDIDVYDSSFIDCRETGGSIIDLTADIVLFSNCTFSGNTGNYGGAIATIATTSFESYLNELKVDANTIFSGNRANTGWYMTDTADIAMHRNNIKATQFSSPFTDYAYNNYDIGYTKGRQL